MTRVSGHWIENKPTQRVCNVLQAGGYDALFVGGCVRNALLGVPVSDIDIATNARPETVTALFEDVGIKVVPTGLAHGTVTVIVKGIPHEITTYRRDVETDGRRAVVAFSDSIKEDALRRDFTMNALYADAAGEVLDPIGGMSDLENRYIRFIEDPGDRIREDYLRILRFFRFHAWYGDPTAGMDAEGLAAIAENLDGLASLSRERVGSEIRKLLLAADPAPAVAAMRSSGVLAAVMPGASDRALAPLVHLEAEIGMTPEFTRRLAALGGEGIGDGLRLSRKDVKRISELRDRMVGTADAGELGYRFGFDFAQDCLVLKAAVVETALDDFEFKRAQTGADAVFPVRADDLSDRYQGRALGQMLKLLERQWIESGFELNRKQLLLAVDGNDKS